MINVADIVTSSDFQQPITRITRTETVNGYGESSLATVSSTIMAVVTSLSVKDLMRFEDATAYKDAIKVTTTTPLNADTAGMQPDLIIYHGNSYIVQLVNDYADFGYMTAFCKLIDLQS